MNIGQINVDSNYNNSLAAIIKNNYNVDYGTQEYEEIKDLIQQNNPEIYNSDRKTLNDSGNIDETFLYVGDTVNLPEFDDINNLIDEIENETNEVEDYVFDDAIEDTIEDAIKDVVEDDVVEDSENAADSEIEDAVEDTVEDTVEDATGTIEADNTIDNETETQNDTPNNDTINDTKENPDTQNDDLGYVFDDMTDMSSTSATFRFENQTLTKDNTDDKKDNELTTATTTYVFDVPSNQQPSQGEEILKDNNIAIDGNIDYTRQSLEGNCWLLSGLNSLSYTEEGKDAIKDAISVNDDGSVDVYFKGIDKSYNVTLDELKKDHFFRCGDDDVSAINIAMRKYRQDLVDGERFGDNYYLNYTSANTQNGLLVEGGHSQTVWQLFGFDNYQDCVYGDSTYSDYDNLFNEYKNDQNNSVLTFTIRQNESLNLADSGAKLDILSSHAYTIKEIEKNDNQENIVVIVNPYNSKMEYKIKESDFKSLMSNGKMDLTYCKL